MTSRIYEWAVRSVIVDSINLILRQTFGIWFWFSRMEPPAWRGAGVAVKGVSLLSLSFILGGNALASGARSSEGKDHVDLMLVLATDVSNSIEPHEYELQKKGIATALSDPDLGELLEHCNGNGIAINYVEWSGADDRDVVEEIVPWTKVSTKKELLRFAQRIGGIGQRSSNGFTDIDIALSFSAASMETAPFESPRRIIDISSDGHQNVQPRHTPAGPAGIGTAHGQPTGVDRAMMKTRDRVVADGIIINALVITLLESKSATPPSYPILNYFNDLVRGGPDSFVIEAPDFDSYAAALTAKLRRELNNCVM